MIPRFRPQMGWGEVLSLALSPRGNPEALEAAFAKQYDYPHAVWFPLGRVAVRAYLETLALTGPKVSLSPFNCVALGNAVVASGATPLWVDTVPGGFSEDPEALLESLDRPDVGCGIGVAQWGIVSHREYRTAPKPVLYDYALSALSAHRPGLRDKDAVVYSLNWSKPLAFLSGALLCGESAVQADQWRNWRERHLRGTSRRMLKALGLKVAFHPWAFGVARRLFQWGMGARLSGDNEKSGIDAEVSYGMPTRREFQLTLKRLAQRDRLREERAERVRLYQEGLGDLPGIVLPPAVDSLSHYPVCLKEREELHQYLLKQGIFSSTDLFSRLLNEYPWLKGELFAPLIEARRLQRTTLHLPFYPGLPAPVQHKVISSIQKWHAERYGQKREAA